MLNKQRVYIYNGELSYLVRDDWRYYPVFNQNGQPSLMNYMGDAYVGTIDGVDVVRIEQGCNLLTYKVSDEPTPLSKAYNEGYALAMGQKRMNKVKALSGWDSKNCEWKSPEAEKLHDGWMDGWKEKKSAA